MGRRNIIRKYPVLAAADTVTSPTSIHTDVSGVDTITYQVEIGALVNASLSVKASNDAEFNPATAFALNFGAPTPLNGATDTQYLVTIKNSGFKWLQLAVTNNAGTGTVSAWITGTTVGA